MVRPSLTHFLPSCHIRTLSFLYHAAHLPWAAPESAAQRFIKSADEARNWSEISNIVFATTRLNLIAFDQDTIDFARTLIFADLPFRKLKTWNDLDWTITADQPWIMIHPSEGSLSLVDSIQIEVNRFGLDPGLHEGGIEIISELGGDTVTVQLLYSSDSRLVSGFVYEYIDVWDSDLKEFFVDSIPRAGQTVILNGRESRTDSNGYYLFWEPGGGELRFELYDPLYEDVDTTLYSNSDLRFDIRQKPLLTDYYPLAIGNSWKYEYWYSYQYVSANHVTNESNTGEVEWNLTASRQDGATTIYTVLLSYEGTAHYYGREGGGEYDSGLLPFERTTEIEIREDANRLFIDDPGFGFNSPMDFSLIRRYYPIDAAETIEALQRPNHVPLKLKRGIGLSLCRYSYSYSGDDGRYSSESGRMALIE